MGDRWDHGCRGCGSVPTNPGNDVKNGELTVNYVENPCSSSICKV
jgi:Kp4 protein